MKILFRVFTESFNQAFQQLRGNKLRTFLSLLGITIGIFCIIGVQSAVDSLQDNVMGSLKKLGDDTVYVSKFTWAEDPGKNWWKFQRRPSPSYDDLLAIKQKVKSAGTADYHQFIGQKTAKYRSTSVERCFVVAVTYDFDQLFNPDYYAGRYTTVNEYETGSNKVLIGYKVYRELFGEIDPIGKHIKVSGKELEVIGVFAKSGKDLLKVMDYDQCIMMGYELAKEFANVKENNPWGGSVNVKAAPGHTLDELKGEITGVLRAERHLKPKEEDNFALNSISLLAKLLDQFFDVLNTLGWFIGGFSILVGVFSVANIMFVSVKERTNIIGIKKALGAKRSVILVEFLVESIILCIFGGLFGLGIVYLLLKILSSTMPFAIYLDWGNVVFGLGLSVFVGILSGFIPAMRAAAIEPVVAIRQGG